MRPLAELPDLHTLAQRYGITVRDVDAYHAWATDADMVEAACAARGRGVPQHAIVVALRDGATVEQVRALRSLNEQDAV